MFSISGEDVLRRCLGLPFSGEAAGYVDWMRSQGYADGTIAHRFYTIQSFCRFLKSGETIDASGLFKLAVGFVDQRLRQSKELGRKHEPESLAPDIRRHIRMFLDYLVSIGRIEPCAAPTVDPCFKASLDQFSDFLLHDQGLALATIEYYRYYATRAAAYFHAAGIGTWPELTSGLVDAFLTHQSKTTGRRGMRPICYALRSFFKFLRRQGHPLPDRLEQFPMPRIYRHEDLPCFIHADRVQRLLDGVDLATNAGIRDYAILLLLSTYGVRAAEVARLELDDIDWAGEIVHLRRRKSGRTDRLPLSIPVGEAILEYLRRARPKTTFRQIFLTTRAPVRPFKNGAIVTGLARKYLVAAGVDLPRLGAHTLRHTTAQHLLTEGFSYKIIGDYLGHSSPSSTSVYLKVDLQGLSQVALNDGEDLL